MQVSMQVVAVSIDQSVLDQAFAALDTMERIGPSVSYAHCAQRARAALHGIFQETDRLLIRQQMMHFLHNFSDVLYNARPIEIDETPIITVIAAILIAYRSYLQSPKRQSDVLFMLKGKK